ncbi:hypothetical protein AVEN_227425-1, partial [Araneus ventricosus]
VASFPENEGWPPLSSRRKGCLIQWANRAGAQRGTDPRTLKMWPVFLGILGKCGRSVAVERAVLSNGLIRLEPRGALIQDAY